MRSLVIMASFLMAASVLHAGCSNSADSSILFGGQTTPSSGPVATASIPSPTERPARVAFISACAQAYGYAHDAAQLRAAYLSYESRHGATKEQLGQIARDYDGAYAAIADLGSSSKSSYCATKDGTAVGAELKRYQSGYFEAKNASSAEGFEAAKLWAGQGDKRGGR
jgi:hypothetical protein